jgi:pimeloyl-ACP methyl ester carboxylesterase
MIHGTGGNFYTSTLFEALGARLLALGCGVLRVNTRGHDGISNANTNRGGRRLGAAYEIVDDCRHDVQAYVDFLKQYVGPRVAVIGHSLGGVKSLYALAHEPQMGAACVLALSPPCLSYARFCGSPQAQQFLDTYRQAERFVENGQPGALLEVQLPLPFVIAAAGYIEKYGPDERYNFLNFIASVPSPTLVTFGSIELENNMAFRGAPEALAPLAARHGNLTVEVIEGADHFYSAGRTQVVGLVESWLKTHVIPLTARPNTQT